MFETLKLSDLPGKQCGILRAPSSTRPRVCVVEANGERAVVKDFSVNRSLFRNTGGRFLVWRERRAYARLKGIRGVPKLYGVIGGLALVMEEIQGTDLRRLRKKHRLPAAFFRDLRRLVREMHDRGLAHCDLKKAPNILLGDDGLPYIVDLSASISRNEFRLPPLNLIYRRFVLDDDMAVIKHSLRHAPEGVTEAERTRYNRRGLVEKLIRAIRDRLRALLQKIS